MELHIGMGLEPVLILLVGVEVVEDDVKLSARKGRGEAQPAEGVKEGRAQKRIERAHG